MGYENILFDVNDGVARITLNRPQKLNSFNVAMHLEVRDAIEKIKSDSTTRVLIVTGAGRGFCAGQDLEDRTVSAGEEIDLGESIERYYAPLLRSIHALPIPVLCAVNGVAAGAGAQIAFACDIVVAAKSASFIEPFCKLGLIPDTGGTYILPRLAGTARAMGIAMFGDKISAEQAVSWGLIWRCVDDAELGKTVDEMAAGLASGPTRGFAGIKHAIYASAGNTLDQQLDLERDLMRELGRSHDYKEGVAAFFEKRRPQFTGK